MARKILFSILLCFIATNSYSQKIALLTVELPAESFGMDIPLSVSLDEITYLPDTILNLYEVNGTVKEPVLFQIEQGDPRKMHWMVKTGSGTSRKHLFELVREKPMVSEGIMATAKEGTLIIHKGEQNLLQYFYKTVYPPPGIDTAYRRSGFIHPLWSPNGQVLTRIQPPDHYHHYGIWNPWTQVEFEGDVIDFWNINSKQGTVRFANFITIQSGAVFSEFKALHEHVVFKKEGGEKVALNEIHGVKVYSTGDDQDAFIVDFNIQMNCATGSPFKILEYRYAGLGWRTTEKWTNKNSMVLTSEGKSRKDADGSKARWCIVQGEIDNDYAGVVMMSFPTNYNYPEPLRIWPENQYDRGDMFANFCPTKDMDWLLNPYRNYVLRYRMLVFNGRFDKEKAESAWHYFANPPQVTIEMVR